MNRTIPSQHICRSSSFTRAELEQCLGQRFLVCTPYLIEIDLIEINQFEVRVQMDLTKRLFGISGPTEKKKKKLVMW